MIPSFLRCETNDGRKFRSHYKDKSAFEYWFGLAMSASKSGGSTMTTAASVTRACFIASWYISFVIALLLIFSNVEHISVQNNDILRSLEARQPTHGDRKNDTATTEIRCETFVLALTAHPNGGAQEFYRFLSMFSEEESGICSYYETYPTFAGPQHERINREGMQASYAWRRELKAQSLDRTLRDATQRGCRTVFEVSSQALDNWYDVGIDHLSERCDTLYVLVLRRYMPYAVQYLQMGDEYTNNRAFWYRAPSDRSATVPMPPPPPPSTPTIGAQAADNQIYWYLADNEARVEGVKAQVESINTNSPSPSSSYARVIDVRIEELSRLSGISRLCNTLGIGDALLEQTSGPAASQWRIPVNAAAGSGHDSSGGVQKIYREMSAFLDQCRKYEISLPEIPGMEAPERAL